VEVSKSLELTKDQRREIRDLAQKSQKTTKALRSSQNDDNRQEIQQKITAILAETREAALKLLTEEQQKKWKKLMGEPFELPRPRRTQQE
jgi:TRAP-type C4-dicarboxylate transport system substrate-binding protein